MSRYTLTHITVTLADGTLHPFTTSIRLRNWKSWALRQLPYGTDVTGATFTRRIEQVAR